MRNNTISGLLMDAAENIRDGRHVLAHRLLCNALRIARGDHRFPAWRLEKIEIARAAIASTF